MCGRPERKREIHLPRVSVSAFVLVLVIGPLAGPHVELQKNDYDYEHEYEWGKLATRSPARSFLADIDVAELQQ